MLESRRMQPATAIWYSVVNMNVSSVATTSVGFWKSVVPAILVVKKVPLPGGASVLSGGSASSGA